MAIIYIYITLYTVYILCNIVSLLNSFHSFDLCQIGQIYCSGTLKKENTCMCVLFMGYVFFFFLLETTK